MKTETVLKILKRYKKGLEVLNLEAQLKGESKDSEHYRNDQIAFETAIKIIERSNT